jgi:hypothetical protein
MSNHRHARHNGTTAPQAREDECQRALAYADASLKDAGQAMSAAALACLRASLDAPSHVRAALTRIAAARDAIRVAQEAAGSPPDALPTA